MENFKKSILAGRTFLKKDSVIVLVCGAQDRDGNVSGRNLILNYANRNLPHFKFFQAEQVFSTLSYFKKKKDLLYLEDQFASYSDCIIVILESAGSFAEIGAFAIKDDIAKLLLVINDIRFIKDQSFINLGPVAKVNKMSIFRPTIYVNPEQIMKSAHILEERLSRIQRKQKKLEEIRNYEEFANCKPKIKLMFIADIISLLSPITKRELYKFIRFCYNYTKRVNLDVELGLLEALNIIAKKDEYYFRNTKEIESFFYFIGVQFNDIRSEVFNYYYKYQRYRVSVLNYR